MDANNLAKWEELKLAHLQLRLSSFLCDLAGLSLVWKKTKTNQMRPSNCYLSRTCCSKGVKPPKRVFSQRLKADRHMGNITVGKRERFVYILIESY